MNKCPWYIKTGRNLILMTACMQLSSIIQTWTTFRAISWTAATPRIAFSAIPITTWTSVSTAMVPVRTPAPTAISTATSRSSPIFSTTASSFSPRIPAFAPSSSLRLQTSTPSSPPRIPTTTPPFRISATACTSSF